MAQAKRLLELNENVITSGSFIKNLLSKFVVPILHQSIPEPRLHRALQLHAALARQRLESVFVSSPAQVLQ